jgi:hypothetical protein
VVVYSNRDQTPGFPHHPLATCSSMMREDKDPLRAGVLAENWVFVVVDAGTMVAYEGDDSIGAASSTDPPDQTANQKEDGHLDRQGLGADPGRRT